jgi:MOSC domain-containing protein YiiM
LHIGDEIAIGHDVFLEVTQIGKECHNPCAIAQKIGECVMPTAGVFARVKTGGVVMRGDTIVLSYKKFDFGRMYKSNK